MIRAIIFDLDNTLTDFMKMKEAAIDAAVEAIIDAGLNLPKDEIKRKIQDIYDEQGIEYQQVFDDFLKRELGHIDHKKLAAAIVAYRRARDSSLIPYPHVNLALVELVKRGLKLAVISDAPRLQAWLRLCYLQLQHIFDHVVTFEDTHERKPSPAPFRKALSLLGVKPDEALMVGDWPERDMVGASQLGIKTVFARYGDTFGTIDPGADYEISDILELLDIVDGLNDRVPGDRSKSGLS
ncbi:MAG: HAD-IA family hydrolase [Candidatus Eisenbacteria bacterium]|nr:HAD-IA family hydrolase [Candidatus Eisenbacteria bacterium]